MVSCARINTRLLCRCVAAFAQMHPEGASVSVLKRFVFLCFFFWDFFIIINIIIIISS